MKQTEIDAFLAVITCGSFSGAAQKLYIGQSALSSRIRSLEEELGVSLFQRKQGQKHIELTRQGKLFETYAYKWQKLISETQASLLSEGTETVSIVSGHSITAYIMPEVYKRLQNSARRPSYHFSSYHYHEAFRLIESGEADFGFVANLIYSKTVHAYPLFSEDLVLLTSQKVYYPEIVHPETLNASKEIYIFWDENQEKWHNYWIGSPQQASVHTSDVTLLHSFLEIDDNWAIVPVSLAHVLCRLGTLCWYPLAEAPQPRVTSLICRSNIRDYKMLPDILNEMRHIITHLGGTWLEDSFLL